MRISLPYFKGIRPIVSIDNLPQTESQTAENCKLWNGNLRSWFNYLYDQLLVNKGIIKTIYLYESDYWLEWEAEVDLIEAPVAGDTAGKIFYTGSGLPKKTNRTLATTGSGSLPIKSYPLPLPSPSMALSGVVGGPPNGSGDDRDVNYIWTVVSTWGEESYPSPASPTYTAKNGERIALSSITMIWQTATAYTTENSVYPVASEGGTYLYKCIQAGTSGAGEPTWNATVNGYTFDGSCIWQCFENNLEYKRIYRLEVGNDYATFQYVTQIAVSTTTYNDDVEIADLSNSCPTLGLENGGSAEQDYDPPPDGLQGLCYLGNGIAIGFYGKDVYPSVPYKIWAFPVAYRMTVPTGIVSITIISQGTAIISTNKKLFILQGTAPGSITIDPLPEERPNLSKRGAAAYKTGVVYPAPDGLRYATSESNQLLTQNHYSKEEWAELYPSTMHGAVHNNKYFGFYKYGSTEGGIVFDLITNELTTLDFYCFGTYVDPETDELYFIRSTQMSQFKEFFQNPDARSTSGKATQYDLTGGAGTMASIVQPDYPRNLVINITDANASISAMSITITGTYADGSACDLTLVFGTDLAVGENDISQALSQIESIDIDSVTGAGAGDTIDIGWGKKFGLGNAISAESDVIKVLLDDADDPVASQTISVTYGTIQFGTDPNAAHDYMVMYSTD